MVEHPLDKPSVVTAMACFGAWGGGVLVTQTVPELFWLGIAICFGASILTTWRYWRPIKASFKMGPSDRLPLWEVVTVTVFLVVEIGGSIYLAATPLAKFATTIWVVIVAPVVYVCLKLFSSRAIQGVTLLIAGFLVRPFLIRGWLFLKSRRRFRSIFAIKYAVPLAILVLLAVSLTAIFVGSVSTIDICRHLAASETDFEGLSRVLNKNRIPIPKRAIVEKTWGAVGRWQEECSLLNWPQGY